jgi:hypothetical protein
MAAAVISSRDRLAGRPVAACSGRIQMTPPGPSDATPPSSRRLANTVSEQLLAG